MLLCEFSYPADVLSSVAIASSLYWLGGPGPGNVSLNDFLPSYPTASVELS